MMLTDATFHQTSTVSCNRKRHWCDLVSLLHSSRTQLVVEELSPWHLMGRSSTPERLIHIEEENLTPVACRCHSMKIDNCLTFEPTLVHFGEHLPQQLTFQTVAILPQLPLRCSRCFPFPTWPFAHQETADQYRCCHRFEPTAGC